MSEFDENGCAPEAGKSYRNFVFTLNNYTDEEVDVICALGEHTKYLIFSKEVAPSTGTPHLQGYLVWKQKSTFRTTVRRLGGRAHVAVAKGNAVQNEQYVRKTRECDETPNEEVYEYGTRPMTSQEKGQSEKDRYGQAKMLAVEGKLDDIDPDIYIRHYSTLKKIRDDHILDRDLEDILSLDHEWFWGESGSGKSFTARNRYPDAFLKGCNKWWDGYRGQDVVLIEDFDKKHDVLCHHMKIWADRYPFPAEVKGSSIKIRPLKIIVTSNYHPESIWQDPSDLEPILRRFKMTKFSGTFQVKEPGQITG